MKTKLFLFLAFFAMLFSANAQVTSVAIVGEAAGGWPTGAAGEVDVHQMVSTDGENWTLAGLTVTTAASGGGVKFRANNGWTINWGSAAWPGGTGTQGGANILSIAGTYDVTFNSTTGIYNFAGGAPIPIVKLIGTCLSPATELLMNTADGNIYTVTTVVAAGNAQFNYSDNAPVPAVTIYGGTAFPTGGLGGDTELIPVVAGNYVVTVNLSDGTYSFVAVPVFHTVSITGSGATGWGNDTDLVTTDGENYKQAAPIPLTAVDAGVAGSGEIKFRQDHDWPTSWGGGSFPTGPTVAGDNIKVTTAGSYNVAFVRSTGAYVFGFPLVSLTGAAVGGWGDGHDFDLTTTDGENYVLNNFTIALSDNCKFRADHAWDTSWGAASWPSGVADNHDIPAIAGTYDITFTKSTGAYNFGPHLANATFGTRTFNVSPNPTNTTWKIASGSNQITAVEIVNVLGKVVYTNTATSNEVVVDATSLSNGIYFAKVTAANATETIKLVKN